MYNTQKNETGLKGTSYWTRMSRNWPFSVWCFCLLLLSPKSHLNYADCTRNLQLGEHEHMNYTP